MAKRKKIVGWVVAVVAFPLLLIGLIGAPLMLILGEWGWALRCAGCLLLSFVLILLFVDALEEVM